MLPQLLELTGCCLLFDEKGCNAVRTTIKASCLPAHVYPAAEAFEVQIASLGDKAAKWAWWDEPSGIGRSCKVHLGVPAIHQAIIEFYRFIW